VLPELRAGVDAVGLWVAGVLVRLIGSLTFDPLEGWLRRACRRSNSDPRDVLVLSETLGADVCGADLMLSAPMRLPILLLPLGLPISDGCDRELRTLSCVFGE